MKTVLEILQSTAGYFAKSGIESARLNIEHLLAHVLGLRRMDLYMQFDRPLSEKELGPLRDLVRRRAAGEPLQHLLGTVEFHGHVFKSDKRALIPRPETELFAERIIKLHEAAPLRLADIGTGSGVLALTLAAQWKEAEVHAVDISPDALALAAENANALNLADRVKFWEGGLLQPFNQLPERDRAFNLIVANLPYIPAAEISALSREVQHDPALALDGGPDGTQIIRELIRQSTSQLSGMLALEIGHNQSEILSEFLAESGFNSIRGETDYQGRNRFLFASYG
jgi:release factor glutamine methyltransferase